jgi:hypothetical protein
MPSSASKIFVFFTQQLQRPLLCAKKKEKKRATNSFTCKREREKERATNKTLKHVWSRFSPSFFVVGFPPILALVGSQAPFNKLPPAVTMPAG